MMSFISAKSGFSRILSVILPISMVLSSVAHAQRGGGLSILRDAEIEKTIRDFSEPLFEAAELTPDSVDTYLVNDNTLNAFVAGGQNIFIHTGLIIEATDYNQLVGVIAHETGHITGGHISRFSDGLKGATAMTILGTILGAAAIAAGSGDAGMALMMGGQHLGQRSYLKYSRTQESAADQAGLTILEKTHQSGEGLITFLDYLGDQELLSSYQQDPYARTHPVSIERISKLQQRVTSSPWYKAPPDPVAEYKFRRMQAKLFGYLKPGQTTLNKYPLSDQSVFAKYARAFAYHKLHQVREAIGEINSLIEAYPKDPYFHETKGQILFENGFVREASDAYRLAVKYLPNNALIRVTFAQALLGTEDDSLVSEALESLEFALARDPNNYFAWLQASVAYHRKGNEAMTRYATAERFLLAGDVRGAMVNAKFAMDSLPKNSSEWIRAQDILVITQSNLSDEAQKKLPPLPEDKPDQDNQFRQTSARSALLKGY
ncbi:M48 family metalloprotease [Emcibacter sp.]|uniref:M48 family metalloprotease n=1 Tax=Emcibacter sp. TaxID=1979954 RepID=UPI002AA6C6DF|nr:M48 family metalloprotease [Emcibacter sp.]